MPSSEALAMNDTGRDTGKAAGYTVLECDDMRQVESCTFSEADPRSLARSKGPVGFAGFQCCHYSGHTGLGKNFPLSAKSLSMNSTSQTFIRTCQKNVASVQWF